MSYLIPLSLGNEPKEPGFYFFQGVKNKEPVFVRVERSKDKSFLYVSTKKATSETEFPLHEFSEGTRWSDKIEIFNRDKKS